MWRFLVFVSFAVINGTSWADFPINQMLDAEIAKCQSVMDLKSIVLFSIRAEDGNLSPDQLQGRLSPADFRRFTELVSKIKPYIQSLVTNGEVMDLAGQNALTVECASFAKGALLTGEIKPLYEALRESASK